MVKRLGVPANGNVKITYAGKTIIKKLDGGVIKRKIGIFKKVGMATVKVTYLGNATTKSVTKTVKLKVLKKK